MSKTIDGYPDGWGVPVDQKEFNDEMDATLDIIGTLAINLNHAIKRIDYLDTRFAVMVNGLIEIKRELVKLEKFVVAEPADQMGGNHGKNSTN